MKSATQINAPMNRAEALQRGLAFQLAAVVGKTVEAGHS
jgi:hypothetical protein